MKAILTIKLTAYHRPISICFVGKKLFLIFNKMFTISPCYNAQVGEILAGVKVMNKLIGLGMPVRQPVN
ncbi:hypothetical protein [Aeromonas caviae]|uniref:hypothetical protein n=1 Tax=Aeromonas caviae TaxID=648 RepID=UPI00222EF044|nr:hypothetical protein [Aeromonas caviae]